MVIYNMTVGTPQQLQWSTLVTLCTHEGYPLFCPNTSPPGQNGRHFADDIFKCIFLNEDVWILIKISLKFIPNGPFNNILALV